MSIAFDMYYDIKIKRLSSNKTLLKKEGKKSSIQNTFHHVVTFMEPNSPSNKITPTPTWSKLLSLSSQHTVQNPLYPLS